MSATGGQFSVLRALAGIGIAVHLISATATATTGLGALIGVGGATAAVALAIGLSAPVSGLVAGVAAIALALASTAGLGLEATVAMGLAAVFAAAPDAPFGSWDRRGAPDPGTDWVWPRWWWTAVWSGLSVGYVVSAFLRLPASGWLGGTAVVVALAVPVVAFAAPAARRSLWLVLVALEVGAVGAPELSGGLALGLIAAFDPAWVRARPTPRPGWVFYDGSCALCHATVRFLIAEDPAGRIFRFAPIGSGAFVSALGDAAISDLPDSVIVIGTGGEVLVRSAGALEAGERLGGLWRIAAAIAKYVPIAIRDRVYDGIAANRRAWFGTREEACPLMPPELRTRIQLD